ncbi:uncharacterized protein SAMN05192558_102449 [Actinokineospora alba]|uniref:DUF418 domain-containing protein n=1 Tax=Actinokineospora alba TaxID=504798 RepID=A0A1H0I7Y4_9PSEU|nr:DUF418 domain-containing protein [Actinokineospora alba]TDP64563.1 uncharacterized protein C8E96_0029 [Actinokineospora alba]SDI87098.1 uncharacterized protein SAMN05421871_108148 [Actinokineospora alba]SDO27473.1 uncharacterized protein SAMN05192558_102449 [Actinokineospora alba]
MSAPHRIARVDALRGFALFGILAVNVWAFATGYYASGIADPAGHPVIQLIVSTLFETKFYLLFSFLFGYSFTLQLDSAARADVAFVPRIIRRQLGLAAIGVAHAVLLFHGDILTAYAVLGMVLLALRGLSSPRAVRVAIGLVLIAGTAWTLLGVLDLFTHSQVDAAAVSTRVADSVAGFRGTPETVVAEHLRQLPGTLVVVLLVQAPSALAMFLLGFAAGRERVLAEPERHRALWSWLLRAGLPVGLTGAAFYGYVATYHPGSPVETLAIGVGMLTAPLLTGGYVALLLRLCETRAVAVFAPAGRLALTNYVAQSAVLSVVFLGYGLGLIGRLPAPAVVCVTIALYAAQLAVSAWWVRRHRYGPLEWLLRAATLGRGPRRIRRALLP